MDEGNVRHELEALAAEQKAEDLIEFIAPAQASSPQPGKAGTPKLGHRC